MGVKFIHTADWQIGKQFGQIEGDASALLREARFAAIEKIAESASEHQVDAVLVAGDVFEHNEVKDKTLRRTLNAMQRFSGSWVLLPGNHDAALAQSVWTRMGKLPEKTDNIVLALEPEITYLAGNGLAVLSAPLKRRHEAADLTAWFDSADTAEGVVRVGLAHGSVANRLPESAESHNLIADNRTQTARLDYLALGDWHGKLDIAAKTMYSGTPEQDRFRGNDPGCALLVEIDGAGSEPKVTSLSVGRYQWHTMDMDVFSETDLQELQVRFKSLGEPGNQIVRLALSGNLDMQLKGRLSDLLESWDAQFAYLQIDEQRLKATPSEADIQTLTSVGFVGTALQRLLAVQDDPSHEQHDYAQRAVQILFHEFQLMEGD